MGVRPDGRPPIRCPDWLHLPLRSRDAYRSDDGARKWHAAPVRHAGRRTVLPAGRRRKQPAPVTYDGRDLDEPARAITLEPDEADQVAEILHTHPIADRLLSLERRVDELIGERGR
jgi:TrkA domain protein